VTDLERFFRRLVHNLSAQDRARLHQAIPLGELYTSIIPYRANRRALDLETSEDYELVLMRLCAGEGGFARTGPEEVRARFEQELASPNPDLEVIHQFGDALISFAPRRIAWALQPIEEEQMEPPGAQEQVTMAWPTVESAPAAASSCFACGVALPEGRPVKFCPSCGQNQVTPTCAACGTEVERGWRFCVSCGEPIRA
jgi:hypothetical protein